MTNDITCVATGWEELLKELSTEQTGTNCSLYDALMISMNKRCNVDIEYMSSISGLDKKTIIEKLKGFIFADPERYINSGKMVYLTYDEYLSGQMFEKYKSAVQANNISGGLFEENITAIKSVIPKIDDISKVYCHIGSPWIPPHIIDEFICYLFCLREPLYKRYKFFYHEEDFYTVHDEETGIWKIPHKEIYKNLTANYSKYGIPSMTCIEIIEKTLNNKDIEVQKSVIENGNCKYITDLDKTIAAQEKQRIICEIFSKWIFSDKNRCKELEIIYNKRYGSFLKRHYNGSFLELPGLSCNVSLYKYQKDDIYRIISSPNTLLCIPTGTGKTYIMIIAGHEMRRMGISPKNMYVVPKNITGQWAKMYKELYSNANILVIDRKDFTPAKRKESLIKMRDGDYDAIIISATCFEDIKLSYEYRHKMLELEKKRIESLLENSKIGKSTLTNRLKSTKANILKLDNEHAKDKYGISFDDLGITTVFVDEAHEYRYLSTKSNSSIISAKSCKGAAKCTDMFEKTRYVQKTNGGRGVVFATATPICNSFADIYTMQIYLQNGTLNLAGIKSFDDWISMFCQRETRFEVDVDITKFKFVNRFSFHNMTELTSMLSDIATFNYEPSQSCVPEFDGYEDIMINATDELQAINNDISSRSEQVRSGLVDRHKDNMLKITIDAKMAALDPRLYDSNAKFSKASKVYCCAEKVAKIYRETEKEHLTQVIFCDISVPKPGKFNVYDELKELLISMGVKEEEIAFIHSAETERKRSKLFSDFRDGKIRILISSTRKGGVGVNIQDRLYACHYLVPGWKPADLIQSNGRIIRRGNMNKKVHIYRYIVVGSFDTFMWQLLERKQRMISEILSGVYCKCDADDVDETVLDFATIKAVSCGNLQIKDKFELENKISRISSLKKEEDERRNSMIIMRDIKIPTEIQRLSLLLEATNKDKALYSESRTTLNNGKRKSIGSTIYRAVTENTGKEKETQIMTYQGFKIILPSGMEEKKPFIILRANGEYNVKIGSSGLGCIKRIENVLDGLNDKSISYYQMIEKAKLKQKEIALEISELPDRASELAELISLRDEMDNELYMDAI